MSLPESVTLSPPSAGKVSTLNAFVASPGLKEGEFGMIWREPFEQTLQDDENYVLRFFEPILSAQIEQIKARVNAKIPHELLELLQQTNGVYNERFNEFIVYNSNKIMETIDNHFEVLQNYGNDNPKKFLFFADNGCGELFGYRLGSDSLNTKQIGIYYPISNDFKIICPDLCTWITSWFSGNLET